MNTQLEFDLASKKYYILYLLFLCDPEPINLSY